jgi:protocatechuate 4,5-dioxygenase alpha subunit
LLEGDLFGRFPTLRFIIPHGGGAVPYHWGRYRGLADMLKKPGLDTHLMNNVFFDTCVYHQPGIDLLADVIENKNILFGSEMVGAVRGSIRPPVSISTTPSAMSTRSISDEERHAIFEGNARRVFPRLDAKLKERACDRRSIRTSTNTAEFDDIPGTRVYTAARAQGLLDQPVRDEPDEGRQSRTLQADERPTSTNGTFRTRPRKRCWRGITTACSIGGNVYFLSKLFSTDGFSFAQAVSTMTDMTFPEYQQMMLNGGRSPEGNRSIKGGY